MVTETITQRVSNDLSWARHHALVMLLAILFIFGAVYGIESLVAKHDAQTASQSQLVLAALTAADKEQFAGIQAQILTLTQQNTNLVNSMLQRDKQTVIQQKKDTTLDAAGSATRLMELEHDKGMAIAQGNQVTMDLPLSRAVILDLDAMAPLQADNRDLQSQLNNEHVINTGLNTESTKKDELLAATVKADKDKLDSCQSDARKGKTKYLIIGTILGYMLRVAKF